MQIILENKEDLLFELKRAKECPSLDVFENIVRVSIDRQEYNEATDRITITVSYLVINETSGSQIVYKYAAQGYSADSFDASAEELVREIGDLLGSEYSLLPGVIDG